MGIEHPKVHPANLSNLKQLFINEKLNINNLYVDETKNNKLKTFFYKILLHQKKLKKPNRSYYEQR